MPRTVTPAVLRLRSSPQTFSLGVWRLITTMEWGSMGRGKFTGRWLKVERKEKKRGYLVRTWGAAVLRPYVGKTLVVIRIGVGDGGLNPHPLKLRVRHPTAAQARWLAYS